LIERP